MKKVVKDMRAIFKKIARMLREEDTQDTLSNKIYVLPGDVRLWRVTLITENTVTLRETTTREKRVVKKTDLLQWVEVKAYPQEGQADA